MYRFIGILLCLIALFPSEVFAAISSTTATIDTHTMTRSSSIQTSITVENTDVQTIRYIKIVRPSDAVSITGASSSWTMSWDSDYVILTGRTLASGGSVGVTLDILSGSVDMASTPWIVQVSGSEDGSDLFSATGDLSFTISGDPPDSTSPIIANVSLSTTNSTFTVSWSTDEASNGTLSYGTSNSYGSTKESTSYSRNHSLTATALSQDTTYYFRIDSEDSSGNSANSVESFLVTSDVQPTATPTNTPTPTTGAPAATATPTPTPIPDTTEPIIVLHALSQKSYKAIPSVRISASDEFGVASVWYSINKAAFIRVSGIGNSTSKPIDVSFIPKHAVKSGSYSIQVKAIDRSGNSALSDIITYLIDASGPKVTLRTVFKPVMNAAPRLEGIVTDDTGVASIEYTQNARRTWIPVAGVATENGLEFSIDVLDPLQEGAFSLEFKATDSVGNESIAGPFSFTVDRLSPRSAGVVVRSGPIILRPDSKSHITGMSKHPYTIYISTGGGVVDGTLNVAGSNGSVFHKKLTASVRNDMWEAEFMPSEQAEYAVSVSLSDGINLVVENFLFTFRISTPVCPVSGNATENMTVSVYALDALQNKYILWRAAAFESENPVTVKHGCFSVLLPEGTYRIEAKDAGFTTIDTNSFVISSPTFVSVPFSMKTARCISLWKFTLCSPFHDQVVFQPESGDTREPEMQSGDEKLAAVLKKQTELYSVLKDKAVEVVIMNTWLPESSAMVEGIEAQSRHSKIPVVLVFPFERDVYIKAWRQQSGFTVPVFSDIDGELAIAAGYHLGPVSLRISEDLNVQSISILARSQK